MRDEAKVEDNIMNEKRKRIMEAAQKERLTEIRKVGDEYHGYRISSTEKSSHAYGPCEVCGEHVSEVYIQASMLYFEGDAKDRIRSFFHYSGDEYLFGHKECLEGKREKGDRV